jgi:hypothetical protein
MRLTILLAVMLALAGCDLGDDGDTYIAGPDVPAHVVLTVGPVAEDCGAEEFTYTLSATVVGLRPEVRVVSVRYSADDGWTETLPGVTPTRHLFRGCGVPGREAEGWLARADVELSDRSEALPDTEPVVPCVGC